MGIYELQFVFWASLLGGLAVAGLLFLLPRFPLKLRLFRRPFRASRRERFPGQIPITISVFLLGFGGAGTVLLPLFPATVATVAALGAGVALVYAAIALLSRIFGHEAEAMSGGTVVGSTAQVSLAIPNDGVGAIAYFAEGKRHTLPARTPSGLPLPIRTDVVVLDLSAGVAVVDPL